MNSIPSMRLTAISLGRASYTHLVIFPARALLSDLSDQLPVSFEVFLPQCDLVVPTTDR